MRTRARLAAALLACLAAATPTLAGLGERADEPVFAPVPTPRSPVATVAPRASGVILDFGVLVRPVPRRPVVQLPRSVVIRVSRSAGFGTVGTVGGHRRVEGVASWYCGNGSHCTRGYPSGLYAAAGPSLRVGSWRGRAVLVSANGRSVRVKLIDWCACPQRALDLYSDAFIRLAPLSRGVVKVTVSW